MAEILNQIINVKPIDVEDDLAKQSVDQILEDNRKKFEQNSTVRFEPSKFELSNGIIEKYEE